VSFGSPFSKLFWPGILGLLPLFLGCALAANGQSDSARHEAKAKFLAAAAEFVEWPASTFPTPATPFELCVYGDFSFGISLAELTRTAQINGHRIEVKWVRKDEELSGCQLLFVSRSAAKRYEKVLGSLRNATTLTIGEGPEFLPAGGMLSVEMGPTGLAFDVNLDAVSSGHLKISSQMLSLARRIVRRTESAHT
jgi:uncharacterized protein DUF4154